MSSFRDELVKGVVSKSDFNKGIQTEMSRCIETLLDDSIEEMYKLIKKEIRQKARNSDYEQVGGNKKISGYVVLNTAAQLQKFEQHRGVLRSMKQDELCQKYLSNYPDAYVSFDTDDGYFHFGCKLVEIIRHDPFFGKRYYTYYCTETAKKILKGVQRKAAIDDIEVSFAHILLGGYTDHFEIPDGGDDRDYSGHRGCLAWIRLKYSITF